MEREKAEMEQASVCVRENESQSESEGESESVCESVCVRERPDFLGRRSWVVSVSLARRWAASRGTCARPCAAGASPCCNRRAHSQLHCPCWHAAKANACRERGAEGRMDIIVTS